MTKQYIVTAGALGGFPQGHLLSGADLATIPADRLTELEAQGAIRPATAAELAATDVARDLPTGTTAKAAALAPDSVPLTTGQVGGAPVPHPAPAAADVGKKGGK